MNWSSQISFMAIALLYPLKVHPRSFYISRAYASILLFPALILSIYTLKITVIDQAVINKLYTVPFTPIVWGSQLTEFSSIIIFSAILSLLLLIFLLPKSNYTENISLLSAYLGLISVFSISSK